MPEFPETTCPICKRTWTPSMFDDFCIPACGCYGDEFVLGATPCEPCGIRHAWNCPNLKRNKGVARDENPLLVEVWPDGTEVLKGVVSQDSEIEP